MVKIKKLIQQKHFLSQKIFGPNILLKKVGVHEHFGSKKFGPKKLFVEKNVGSKKGWVKINSG